MGTATRNTTMRPMSIIEVMQPEPGPPVRGSPRPGVDLPVDPCFGTGRAGEVCQEGRIQREETGAGS